MVDGETSHFDGDKIRLADIKAPEVSEPACDHELDLGEAATDRLKATIVVGAPGPGQLCWSDLAATGGAAAG